MGLSKLVTSLAMSKKLKEAGFEMDTPFWWTYEWDINNWKTGEKCVSLDFEIEQSEVEEFKLYPSYTFQQLWEVLVMAVTPIRVDGLSSVVLDQGELRIHGYSSTGDGFERYPVVHLPDAVAQAILCGIENSYIDVNKLNKDDK